MMWAHLYTATTEDICVVGLYRKLYRELFVRGKVESSKCPTSSAVGDRPRSGDGVEKSAHSSS
jgi:hypothetical protein